MEGRNDYSMVTKRGIPVIFRRRKKIPRSGPRTSRVAEARLYFKTHNIKVWDSDEICKARGLPTAEERRAKMLEEAKEQKRYLGLDPSEAEAEFETKVNDAPRNPIRYVSIASYAVNKFGGKRCLIFKHVRQDPNSSAASVATVSGDKEAEVGGRFLLKRPHEDLDKSNETYVKNAKPETDSSATLVASGNN